MHSLSDYWNSMWALWSVWVVKSDTLATFKKRLKTHLFHCVMWNVLATERLCISYYGAIQVVLLYSYCIVYLVLVYSCSWNMLYNYIPYTTIRLFRHGCPVFGCTYLDGLQSGL